MTDNQPTLTLILITTAAVLLIALLTLAAARTPDVKTHLQRQVAATDRQIDGLVYELYGLTEEEIGIVEGEYRE